MMIYKKGESSDPANYRGIALINTITKIFTNIIRYRLEKWAGKSSILPRTQLGFRRNRGCSDCIFTLIVAIQLQLRLGERNVYATFIDFKRAFDSIPHSTLWAKLSNLGVSTKLINLIRSLYGCAEMQVRSNKELSDSFEVTEGVLQGESLSPLLFLLFIADFEEYFRVRGRVGVNIDGTNDLISAQFADDTVLVSESQVGLSRMLGTLHEYCSLNGLEVNSKKTFCVVYGWPCQKISEVQQNLRW